MLTDRIRVLPPFDARGTVIYHGAFGSAVGLLKFAVFSNVYVRFFFPLAYYLPLASVLLFLAGMAVPVLLAWRLARQCQRWRLIFACGFSYGAMALLAEFASAVIVKPEFWHEPWQQVGIGILFYAILSGVLGAFFGGVYMLVAAVFRSIRYRVITQDGTLCRRCAYIVGNPPISERCAECGDVIEPCDESAPGLRARIRQVTKRLSRPLAACALLASLILIILHGRQVIALYAPMFTSVAHDGKINAAFFNSNPAAPATAPMLGGATGGLGVWKAVPSHSDKAIAVLYAPTPQSGQPRMQLQLMASPTSIGSMIPGHGSHTIVCDLNVAQTQFVLANDVPDSLLDAMIDAAANANWQPQTRGGRTVLLEVKPDGHFPQE